MLSKLLGSKLRAKLLGRLFVHPAQRYFVRQLHSILGEDATNISRELARMAGLGIVTCQTEGRQKYYQADPDCPIFEELRSLAAKTIGLADVVRAALEPLAERIQLAFIYGSQARGEATAASDVDLLIVGDVEAMAVHRAIMAAEKQLGRSVNYTLLSTEEFARRRKAKAGFLARVLAGEKMAILGQGDDV